MNIVAATILPYRHDRWKGLVHHDWASCFANQDPLSWMMSLPYERSRYRLSRQIYRVHIRNTPGVDNTAKTTSSIDENSADEVVYLKVILGLNERSMHASRSWIDRLKWQLRPSRALATFLVSQAMLNHDIWCPGPILAAREHKGSESRDIFIAQAVELPGLGTRLIEADNDAVRIDMVTNIAPHIATLHQKRFLHGDLLPNNLHVTDDLQRVCFMDNDRTRQWPCKLPWWAVRRNLAQLSYRLLFHQGKDVTQAFLTAYAKADNWSPKQTVVRCDAVLAVAQQRLKNYVPHNPQPPLPDDDLPPGQAPD